MARRSKKVKFDSAGWLEFHAQAASSGGNWKLDKAPGGPELLKSMLESMAPGTPITWSRVRDYILKQIPEAPAEPKSYRNYAEAVLGWRPTPPRRRA